MDLHLKDKSVFITGGGTGIGKAIAHEFALEGAGVAICGRRAEPLEKTAAEFASEGLSCAVYSGVDVADAAAFKEAAESFAAGHGGLDVLVNNAGINIIKPISEYSEEEFNKVIDINLKGVFNGCRIAGEIMKAGGKGGVIINASSFASVIPHTTAAVYAATKAGVSNFTRTFAASYAPFGIRVAGYIPGMIITDMSSDDIKENEKLYVENIPLQRLGRPEDLAKPVVFLASDACAYVTGFDFRIDGGKYAVQDTLIPWS